MPMQAPYTRSVPQDRAYRNSWREKNTKPRIRHRCASRTACMADRTLPQDARLAYYWMDDYAGAGGIAYPKQATLAAKLGCSRQQAGRLVAVLVEHGWLIPIARTGRAIRYQLKWAFAGTVAGTVAGVTGASDEGIRAEHRNSICNPVCNQPEVQAQQPAESAVTEPPPAPEPEPDPPVEDEPPEQPEQPEQPAIPCETRTEEPQQNRTEMEEQQKPPKQSSAVPRCVRCGVRPKWKLEPASRTKLGWYRPSGLRLECKCAPRPCVLCEEEIE